MFGALKPALSKLVFSYSEYMANFKPKRTAAASCDSTAFLSIFEPEYLENGSRYG